MIWRDCSSMVSVILMFAIETSASLFALIVHLSVLVWPSEETSLPPSLETSGV